MFLATHLPPPLPPTSTLTSISVESAATASAPAFTAALDRFDIVIRNALGRVVYGDPYDGNASGAPGADGSSHQQRSVLGLWTTDQLIATVTMLVVFFLAFLFLLVLKLLLGMVLLRYARGRYARVTARDHQLQVQQQQQQQQQKQQQQKQQQQPPHYPSQTSASATSAPAPSSSTATFRPENTTTTTTTAGAAGAATGGTTNVNANRPSSTSSAPATSSTAATATQPAASTTAVEPPSSDMPGCKRVGGYGYVEVGDDRRRMVYADDPEGLRKVQEREAKREKATAGGTGREERDWSGIMRYEMVAKRIW